MGRPRGSKNKKIGENVVSLKFEKQIQNTPITKPSSFHFVNWGSKNLYPNDLLDLYAQSPTHHSACEFAITSILGNGVDFEAMKLNGDEVVPNPNQTWDEVIKGLATDYIIFGSYALEVIMNNDGQTFSFYHIPLDRVRWSEFDANGNIPSYWISADWSAPQKYPPVEIAAMKMGEKMKKGVPYLYVYRTYTPTLSYYQQPHYAAGISAIQAEIEFLQHDLKSAVNNFVPSGMLVLNAMETDEQRQAAIQNINDMFVGSSNSNSLMITFRSNSEEEAPSFVPFTAGGNINIYADANQRSINRILCAHQIPNAALIGMPDIANSGFASEADKLEVSYQLYEKLTGNRNRMAVLRTLNQMLKLNGIETEIIMKPLNFNDFGDDANVRERTTADAIDTDNVKNVEE